MRQLKCYSYYKRLQTFGAPLPGVSVEDFSVEGTIFQIGLAPVRIDLITKVDGITFEEAYLKRNIHQIGEIDIPYLSVEMLIRNKTASGRPKDMIDVGELKRL